MILGIGTDIVSIPRIKKINLKFPIFARKILSDQELQIYNKLALNKKDSYLAKRFAAKEALSKAIGTGLGLVGLHNMSILNDPLGKPYVIINASNFQYNKSANIKISLSDDKDYAVAFVVIEI